MRETPPSDTSSYACQARVIALAVTCCAVAVAACGSPSTPTQTTASSPVTAALKFAECMRSHGVPNFRDPTPNGEGSTIGKLDKRSPEFRTAPRERTESPDPADSMPPANDSGRVGETATTSEQ